MNGKEIELDKVVMRFGDFTAVQETDLVIRAGEFFSVLGPSGCGKTTILRMISGFMEPSEGRILIGGEDMVGLGPNKRPTALIFQNLALFPLMTVWENVAFGLEARGVDKKTRKKRAEDLLDMVGLTGQGGKTPGQLSGGQKQRVAIARALAVEPSVLLLDEPLSALDLKLRQHMRGELKEIQKKTGVTFVFITHDQGEALMMSDRIAVMKKGVVEQIDSADAIYDNPRTPFVATFVGENNVFRGRVTRAEAGFAELDTPHGPMRGRNRDGIGEGAEAMIMIRPERMALKNGAALDNMLQAKLDRRDLEGAFINLFLHAGADEIVVHRTNDGRALGHEDLHDIGFMAEDALVLPAGELADD